MLNYMTRLLSPTADGGTSGGAQTAVQDGNSNPAAASQPGVNQGGTPASTPGNGAAIQNGNSSVQNPPPAQSVDASTDFEREAKSWQKKYNDLAANIRSNESKVETARTNEARANERVQQLSTEKSAIEVELGSLRTKSMRLEKLAHAGIPAHLHNLVTADTPEEVDGQIETIRTSLIGSSTTPQTQQAAAQPGQPAANSGSGNGNAPAPGTTGGDQNQPGQAATSQATQQPASTPDNSGSGATYVAPSPSVTNGDDFVTKFAKADGAERDKMQREVKEGRRKPNW